MLTPTPAYRKYANNKIKILVTVYSKNQKPIIVPKVATIWIRDKDAELAENKCFIIRYKIYSVSEIKATI
jgi:hypothetical protein